MVLTQEAAIMSILTRHHCKREGTDQVTRHPLEAAVS